MKVRIYKAGGPTGKFISKLDKFLPTAAEGVEVDEMKQLKQSIKYLLDDKNQSANTVVMQLIKGGYDYEYAKNLVDKVEDEIEEDYYSKKSKKDKNEYMLDSDLIPNEDELEEEDDRAKRKMMSQNMQDDIAQTAQDVSDDDSDDEDYDEESMELANAAYGMEIADPKIKWPGMFNDMASLKKGGVPNKKKFINSTVKKLMKAQKGMAKDPTMNDMPNPFGTLDNPRGIDLTPNKAVVSAIKGEAQNFVDEQAARAQAEAMYNQQFMHKIPMAEEGGGKDWVTNLHNYGESLSHSMPSMNTIGMNNQFNGQEMSFGGASRRVRRANRAFFGLPIAPPGAKTDYQFGPLGGLKKGQVEWDMAGMAQALKNNPQLVGMLMPKMGMGMPSGKGLWNWWTSNAPSVNFANAFNSGFMNSGSNWSSSSSYNYGTPKTRLKWATETVNNAADPAKNDEASKLKNNSDETDKRKKHQEYIDWFASLPNLDPTMHRVAPLTYEEFITNVDGVSEYDHWAGKTKPVATSSATVFEQGGFVDFDRPDLNRFIYGGNEYEYGGDIRRFNNGGQNQIDLNYRDAAGKNYQDYIDFWAANSLEKGMSRQIPLTWEEWKKDVDADKGVTTTNTSNTQTQNPFTQKFQDPKFMQQFEAFLQQNGLPTNAQLRQQQQLRPQQGQQGSYFQWTNNQGTPLVGLGQADNSGIKGAALSLLGLKKDAKAYYSPQGQITRDMIAQMMKDPTGKVRQTQFKDRDKWWNPFDTKKVTEWERFDGTSGTTTPGKTTSTPNAPGYNPTAAGPGYSGYNADSDGNGMPDYLQVPNPQDKSTQGPVNQPQNNQSMAPTNNVGPMTNPNENTGIDQTPADWQYNQPAMDYMKQSLTVGQGQDNTETQPATTNIPNTGINEDIPEGSYLRTFQDENSEGGIDRQGRLVTTQYKQPNDKWSRQLDRQNRAIDKQNEIINRFDKAERAFEGDREMNPYVPYDKDRKDYRSDRAYYKDSYPYLSRSERREVSKNFSLGEQPGYAPLENSPVYESRGEMRQARRDQRQAERDQRRANRQQEATEEGMAYGGFIPSYMAYGGYMPDYGYGGMMHFNPGGSVVGPNPDFAGPQQNDFAKDADANGIPDYLEVKDGKSEMGNQNNLPDKIRLEEENMWSWDPKKLGRNVDLGVRGYTALDEGIESAKAQEAENAKLMYAGTNDYQPLDYGLGDPNEGVGKAYVGYKGRNVRTSKFGGPSFAKGGSYSKGKVYSLTMDEINEIKRRGGSVKFIK